MLTFGIVHSKQKCATSGGGEKLRKAQILHIYQGRSESFNVKAADNGQLWLYSVTKTKVLGKCAILNIMCIFNIFTTLLSINTMFYYISYAIVLFFFITLTQDSSLILWLNILFPYNEKKKKENPDMLGLIMPCH